MALQCEGDAVEMGSHGDGDTVDMSNNMVMRGWREDAD